MPTAIPNPLIYKRMVGEKGEEIQENREREQESLLIGGEREHEWTSILLIKWNPNGEEQRKREGEG